MNRQVKEDFFVNYAVRGCQQQAGMCNRSYVSGQPLTFNRERTLPVQYASYPNMYRNEECSQCSSKRKNVQMYPQLGYRQSVSYIDPSAANALFVHPSTDYVYVQKGWTGGS